ncbi:MAG TPA: hypothetical protein VMH33_12905 [Solirubrobacterales bacterium]|nr:hypothetical protein [Solirubrobacterales bacterium]
MRSRLSLLVVVLLALAVPAAAIAAEKVYVESGIYPAPPKVRPHEFLLSGDGTLAIYGVRYQSYGGAVAEATGRGYVRGCTPDCAQGKVYRPQAKIRLSKITRCEGKQLYTKLEYTFQGTLPKGYLRHQVFDLRPIGENGKPLC